jgi:hypothetical protein
MNKTGKSSKLSSTPTFALNNWFLPMKAISIDLR